MLNDEFLIELSAYADGELGAERARVLEEKLRANPALRREMDLFKKFDRTAAAIPVPQVDARLNAVGKMVAKASAPSQRNPLIESTIPAPQVSSQRFEGVWKKIAAQTIAPPQADRDGMLRSALADGESSEQAVKLDQRESQIWRKLDEAAANLPVPQLSDLAGREAWHNIVEQTAAQRSTATIEKAAAALQAPQISDARYAECWSKIAERLAQTPAELRAPAISDERWNALWKSIAARLKQPQQKLSTTLKIPPRTSNLCMPAIEMPAAEMPVPVNVIPVQFTPPAPKRRWSWLAATSAAAVILLSALVFLATGTPDNPTAFEIPESLDDRYGVQVQYLTGQKEPVVCFFLKTDDEEKVESKVKEWQWLPD